MEDQDAQEDQTDRMGQVGGGKMARKEKEPKMAEEFNKQKIRIGDDLKKHLKKQKQREKDTIILRRVRSLKDLPNYDEDGDVDFILYLRDDELHPVFLQTNAEAPAEDGVEGRIYIDRKPLYRDGSASIGISEMQEQQMDEQHDEEDTDYYDFSEADVLFRENELYIEVKKK